MEFPDWVQVKEKNTTVLTVTLSVVIGATDWYAMRARTP